MKFDFSFSLSNFISETEDTLFIISQEQIACPVFESYDINSQLSPHTAYFFKNSALLSASVISVPTSDV